MFKLTYLLSFLLVASAASFASPTAFVGRSSSRFPSPTSLNAGGGDLGPFRMIITGAPASGKGTQCVNIVKNHGLIHLSTGDMLRKAVKEKTPIGVEAEGYMNRGELVPDEVVCGVIGDRLAESDCKDKGVLLDGFPRTKVQAEVLDGILKKNGQGIDVVVFLEVNEESLVERVCGRRVDPETGESYHIKFNPPPADVEGRLIQRDDDTEEKVKVRLQGFNKNVDAISGFYENVGVKVDGNKKPGEVEVMVEKAIRSTVGK